MKIHRLLAAALAAAAAACATPAYELENPSCGPQAAYPKFGRDGHQDTTYIVAVLAGRTPADAARLAFYNQAADDVWLRFSAPPVTFWGSVTDLGYRHRIIGVLHSLHGGDANDVARRRAALSAAIRDASPSDPDYFWTTGLTIHALGDAFAHTRPDGSAYGELYGHAFDGHAPDTIGLRPDLYIAYIETLFDALAVAPEQDRSGLEAYIAEIRALGAADPDRYTHAIRSARAAMDPGPMLDCRTLAGRLTMDEVSRHLRTLEARF